MIFRTFSLSVLLSVYLVIGISSCNVNDREDTSRNYVLSIEKNTDLVIDSIVVAVVIQDVQIDTLVYVARIDGNSFGSRKVSAINETEYMENKAFIYVSSVVIPIEAQKNDHITVVYRCYSNNLIIISKSKSFDFTSNVIKTSYSMVNKKAVEISKEIENVDGDLDAKKTFFKGFIAQRMCDDFKSDEYYKVLTESAIHLVNDEIDSVLNEVMNCMFLWQTQLQSFNGVNKNIPESINVDSVFVERFYDGMLRYSDYNRSSLKAVLPDSIVLDSVLQNRKGL
ncbi:MAG: hypothetical protein OCC49_05905 [Fibrobacterales bacterium]